MSKMHTLVVRVVSQSALPEIVIVQLFSGHLVGVLYYRTFFTQKIYVPFFQKME